MTGEDLENAICRANKYRQLPSPWDPIYDKEPRPNVAKRHAVARMLCNRCPVLEQCEARLLRHEQAGVHIAGVVAGRYTVLRGRDHTEKRQDICIGCGHPLAAPNINRHQKGHRKHQGEGLCTYCWGSMHRFEQH